MFTEFVVSIVAADDLAPVGARSSADTCYEHFVFVIKKKYIFTHIFAIVSYNNWWNTNNNNEFQSYVIIH